MKAKKNTSSGELAKLARLRTRLGYRPDDEGWTVREYAQRYELTQGVAQAEVDRMFGEGCLIKGQARRVDDKGTRRRVSVFRMK